MADSEIAELCRSIYHKHRPAFDLIFEHRPDEQAKMYDFLVSLVEGTPGIILDDSSKQYIRFWPEEWDIPELRVGSRWTSSRRMLLFQLVNVPDRLNIALVVGPGPESVRQDLSRLIREAPAPLKLPGKVGQIWATVYSRKWLSPHDYEDSSPEERESRVRESWQRFLETDLRAIHEALGMPTLATRLQQESQPPYESLNPGHPSLSS